ncbi:MAG: hypothetical protein HZA51_17940 [Planctomycetes bacterium]|nr:hypothetical protein [Planctomycetota bacterium]
MREGSNHSSFTRVKAKVLADRDVRGDSTLQSMVKTYIAEREAVFRTMHAVKPVTKSRPASVSVEHRPQVTPVEAARHEQRYQAEFLLGQFREKIRHYYESEASILLDRLRRINADQPELISAETVATCDGMLRRMSQRRTHFLQHVTEVADRAVAAAGRGAHDMAARALRRLTLIHLAHREWLPDATFESVRDRIIHARDHRDEQLSAQKIVERERTIAAELKGLSERLHRFHSIAFTTPHDTAAYRDAEADYRAAVADVTHHDAEWLDSVIFELVELLNELHDPPPEKADQQVNRFLDRVRAAIQTLRREVNAWKPKP